MVLPLNKIDNSKNLSNLWGVLSKEKIARIDVRIPLLVGHLPTYQVSEEKIKYEEAVSSVVSSLKGLQVYSRV